MNLAGSAALADEPLSIQLGQGSGGQTSASVGDWVNISVSGGESNSYYWSAFDAATGQPLGMFCPGSSWDPWNCVSSGLGVPSGTFIDLQAGSVVISVSDGYQVAYANLDVQHRALSLNVDPSTMSYSSAVSSPFNYSFSGDPGATYTLILTGPDGMQLMNTSITTGDITAIAPGSASGSLQDYSVGNSTLQVIGSNGDQASVTLSVTDDSSGGSGGGDMPISISVDNASVSLGGSVSFSVSGGDMNSYSVSATNGSGSLSGQLCGADPTACVQSGYWAATGSYRPFEEGTMTLTVSDAAGHTAQVNVLVSAVPLNISLSSSTIYLDQDVEFSVSGGSGNYTWSAMRADVGTPAGYFCTSSDWANAMCSYNSFSGASGALLLYSTGTIVISVTDGSQMAYANLEVQHRPLSIALDRYTMSLSEALAGPVHYVLAGDYNASFVLTLTNAAGAQVMQVTAATGATGSPNPGQAEGSLQVSDIGQSNLSITHIDGDDTASAVITVIDDGSGNPGGGDPAGGGGNPGGGDPGGGNPGDGGGPGDGGSGGSGPPGTSDTALTFEFDPPTVPIDAGISVDVTVHGGVPPYHLPKIVDANDGHEIGEGDDHYIGKFTMVDADQGKFKLQVVDTCEGASGTIKDVDDPGNSGKTDVVVKGNPDKCDPTPAPTPPEPSPPTISFGITIDPDYDRMIQTYFNFHPGLDGGVTVFDDLLFTASIVRDENDKDDTKHLPAEVNVKLMAGSNWFGSLVLKQDGDQGGYYKAILRGQRADWSGWQSIVLHDALRDLLAAGQLTAVADLGDFGNQTQNLQVTTCVRVWSPAQYGKDEYGDTLYNKMVLMRGESGGWSIQTLGIKTREVMADLFRHYPFTEDKNLIQLYFDMKQIPASQDNAYDGNAFQAAASIMDGSACGMAANHDILVLAVKTHKKDSSDSDKREGNSYSEKGARAVWIDTRSDANFVPVLAHELGHGVGALEDEYEMIRDNSQSYWEARFSWSSFLFNKDLTGWYSTNCNFDKDWMGVGGVNYGVGGAKGCGGILHWSKKPNNFPFLYRASSHSVMNSPYSYPDYNVIGCAAMKAGLRHLLEPMDMNWSFQTKSSVKRRLRVLANTLKFVKTCQQAQDDFILAHFPEDQNSDLPRAVSGSNASIGFEAPVSEMDAKAMGDFNLPSPLFFYHDALQPDASWGSVDNWWVDSQHTIPAFRTPGDGELVVMLPDSSGGSFSGVAPELSLSALAGILPTDGTGAATAALQIVPGGFLQIQGGDWGGVAAYETGVHFSGSSANRGTVQADAVFVDQSVNYGSVTGDAVFDGASDNQGTVSGQITWGVGNPHAPGASNPLSISVLASSIQLGEQLDYVVSGGDGHYYVSVDHGGILSNEWGSGTLKAPQDCHGSDLHLIVSDSSGKSARAQITVLNGAGASCGSVPLSISVSAGAVPSGQSVTYSVQGGSGSYRISATGGELHASSSSAGLLATPSGCVRGVVVITVTDIATNSSAATSVNYEGSASDCPYDPDQPVSVSFASQVVSPGDGGVAYTVSGGSGLYSVGFDRPADLNPYGSGNLKLPDEVICASAQGILTVFDLVSDAVVTAPIEIAPNSPVCGSVQFDSSPVAAGGSTAFQITPTGYYYQLSVDQGGANLDDPMSANGVGTYQAPVNCAGGTATVRVVDPAQGATIAIGHVQFSGDPGACGQ